MRTAFSMEDVAAWIDALRLKRPSTPTDLDWLEFPQIESFAPIVMETGFAARCRTRDGSELELILNPVAALHLATCILEMGAQAGWLTKEGLTIQIPPAPRLDS